MHSSAPLHTGIGLRAPHYHALLETLPPLAFLEIHPENYFGGGMHLHLLERLSEHYALSFHAVGLSLGSAEPVCRDHLRRIRTLADRFGPLRISDHASWSKSGNAHLNDLLPLPYTPESLDALCRNIDMAQEALGCAILIENPSTYLTFAHSTWDEAEFLAEAVKRTGCFLLLDINNLFVQAHNHRIDVAAYLEAIPAGSVREIHLAGHTEQRYGDEIMLVDTHSHPVRAEVWQLFENAVECFGPVPTLIEWDKDIPPLDMLLSEARRAEYYLAKERKYEAA